MATKIDSKTARLKLPIQREPHWQFIKTNFRVGYRKNKNNNTWHAKYKNKYQVSLSKLYPELDQFPPEQQFDRASEKAIAWLESLGVGGRYTIEQCAADYYRTVTMSRDEIETQKNYEYRVRQIEVRINNHILKHFEGRYIDGIKQSEINAWRNQWLRDPKSHTVKEINAGIQSSNRTLTLLKAMLNLAYRNQLVADKRQWDSVQRYAKKKETVNIRTLVLNDKQLKTLFDNMDGAFYNLCMAQYLIGMRPGIEPKYICVKHLNTKNGTLFIPKGKTGPRTVALSPEALEFFKKISKNKLPEAYLLPNDNGEIWERPDVQLSRVRKLAKLPTDLCLYTLRHTYITNGLLQNIPAKVLAENCGTSVQHINEVYGKFSSHDKQHILAGFKAINF